MARCGKKIFDASMMEVYSMSSLDGAVRRNKRKLLLFRSDTTEKDSRSGFKSNVFHLD